jgi:hypothetical protein
MLMFTAFLLTLSALIKVGLAVLGAAAAAVVFLFLVLALVTVLFSHGFNACSI